MLFFRKRTNEGASSLDKFVIRGGKPLFGEVTVSGAKNAAVAIIPAAVMVDGVCRIENIPMVSDVLIQLEILRELGCGVRVLNKDTVEIDATTLNTSSAVSDLNRKMRASYYLIGAFLGRFGKAEVAMPGGCNFGGVRPIDQHMKGFEALGAKMEIRNGIVCADGSQGLRGANIYLDVASVGATVNIMLAACLSEGQTIIENAAKEPHIVDLANFLNSMGADIMGAGTDVIKIRGVSALTGGFYSNIPDPIEAGTYIAAVAAAGGSVLVKNVIPKHMDCITAKLEEMGCEISEEDDNIRVTRSGPTHKIQVKTMYYPGFPTDMQPQLAAALCLAEGTSVVTEGVWENRFRYSDELRRMGAHIQVDGKVAVIEGVEKLTGAPVRASDLRAGAALVIAGLAAEGTTEIEEIGYIERGYEDIVEKLRKLGADISRVSFEDAPVVVKAN